MANSRFAYVRHGELDDRLLPNTFAVIRLDGKGFTKFSTSHSFHKPNDRRALDLMNAAALTVLHSPFGRGANAGPSSDGRAKSSPGVEGKGIVLGFGESDEFSFLVERGCGAFGRRESKWLTTVLSTFTAAYVFLWPRYFPDSPLGEDNLPTFDGRVVQYATRQEVIDYFKWRQADTHINNLYNTTFWALVQPPSSKLKIPPQNPMTPIEAHSALQGTFSKDKHAILWERFGINYNEEEEVFKRGSLVVWTEEHMVDVGQDEGEEGSVSVVRDESASMQQEERPGKGEKRKLKGKRRAVVVHEDMMKDEWWDSGRGKRVVGNA